MSEFTADEIRDFTRLKRLREAGYYESEGAETVASLNIVADGAEPALRDLRVKCSASLSDPTSDCFFCGIVTLHRAVAVDDTGNPVFHCNRCCKCHLCEKLSAWNGTMAPDHCFCTDCGAMLRCTTCGDSGPGEYCHSCGKKKDVTGQCSDCGEMRLL